MTGAIHSIVYQPLRDEGKGRPKGFLRLPVQEATLRAGHGIEGDRKAGGHPDRQINLVSLEWLLQLKEAGYQIEPGQFGEQITLVGVDLDLNVSDRVQLGGTVCIEIRMPRTPCSRLQRAQQLPVAKLGTIGVMGTVLTGGTIRVGDPVSIQKKVQNATDVSLTLDPHAR